MPNSKGGPVIRCFPFGGVGEFGKNMMVYAVDDDAVIVDCGMGFPEPGQHGVDIVIPDITALDEMGLKIHALLLTHGHEDHIGAVPFILPKLGGIPVYGTQITLALVKAKLSERGYKGDLRLLDEHTPIKIGPFRVEGVPVTHSIMDAISVVIHTVHGAIIHTGDFKFDPSPIDGRVSGLEQFRTRVDAVYHPDHKTYLHVVEYARKTVDLISHSLPGIAFPYPHITIVDGLDAMEYPMMVNNLPFEDEKDVVEFTAHEVFHTIFPFYVGTNETKYSFMDEGWATMTEFLFHPLIAPGLKLEYDISPVNDYAGLAEDVPIMTPTAQLYGKARFADKDLKPALALFYLKEMLGEKKIIRAMQYYINTWAGKHPTPYEFFNCMNAGANENLNWYWKKWYFEKAVPDLAIHQVNRIRDQLRIRIVNKGGAPVPVHLVINFKTTGQKTITKTAAIWKKGNRDINISIKHAGSISKITLGNAMDADVNPKDNLYVR